MQEQEMVSAVRESTGLRDADETTVAIRATLAVLGQRLAGGESADLAAQLPTELAEVMPSTGSGERFGVDEFYRRVAALEGEGCTPAQARQHARATVAAIKTAVTPGELTDFVSQLPTEYDDLLSTSPVHHH